MKKEPKIKKCQKQNCSNKDIPNEKRTKSKDIPNEKRTKSKKYLINPTSRGGGLLMPALNKNGNFSTF